MKKAFLIVAVTEGGTGPVKVQKRAVAVVEAAAASAEIVDHTARRVADPDSEGKPTREK